MSAAALVAAAVAWCVWSFGRGFVRGIVSEIRREEPPRPRP